MKLWFRAKRFGWGWTPITWEGWLVTLCFVLALALLAFAVERHAETPEQSSLFLFGVLVLVVVLFKVCYARGERPRWRWGKS